MLVPHFALLLCLGRRTAIRQLAQTTPPNRANYKSSELFSGEAGCARRGVRQLTVPVGTGPQRNAAAPADYVCEECWSIGNSVLGSSALLPLSF